MRKNVWYPTRQTATDLGKVPRREDAHSSLRFLRKQFFASLFVLPLSRFSDDSVLAFRLSFDVKLRFLICDPFVARKGLSDLLSSSFLGDDLMFVGLDRREVD